MHSSKVQKVMKNCCKLIQGIAVETDGKTKIIAANVRIALDNKSDWRFSSKFPYHLRHPAHILHSFHGRTYLVYH